MTSSNLTDAQSADPDFSAEIVDELYLYQHKRFPRRPRIRGIRRNRDIRTDADNSDFYCHYPDRSPLERVIADTFVTQFGSLESPPEVVLLHRRSW